MQRYDNGIRLSVPSIDGSSDVQSAVARALAANTARHLPTAPKLRSRQCSSMEFPEKTLYKKLQNILYSGFSCAFLPSLCCDTVVINQSIKVFL